MTNLSRLFAVALIVGTAALASADPLRLDFEAHGAGCPAAGRFRDEVAARLGRIPFDDAALSVVRVRIQPDGDRFSGTLEMQGVGLRTFGDEQCPALAETIASSLATQLDAQVRAAAATPPVSVTAASDAPGSVAPASVGPPPSNSATSPAPARFGSSWFSGGLSFSQIWRTSSASGLRAAVGYDRLLTAVSLGARVGVVRHEDSFGSSTLPFVGVRAFWWTCLGATAQLKVGGGAELWLNSESETGINGEPVFLHVLAEAGPRIPLGDVWALDVPIELGVMPYFDPKVYSFQVGAQLVRSI